jgi:dihydrofolate reductase
MYAHCSSFIATSLDGFISRLDGTIDWLDKANAMAPPSEDCGFSAYMSTVDAIVMGRHTFELALSFKNWPYGDTPLYVLSTTLRSLPAKFPSTASLHCCTPSELSALALRHGHRRLYVDGDQAIQGFISSNLMAEITVTVIPVLLGTGRSLFGSLPNSDVWLKHLSSQTYPFGFVQNRYAFAHSDT